MYFDPYWEGWVNLAVAIGKQAATDTLDGAVIARQYKAVQQELDAVARELRRRPSLTRTRRLKQRSRHLRRERNRLYTRFLEGIEAPRAAWYLTKSPLWKLTLTVIQMDDALMTPKFREALQLVREMDQTVPLTVRTEVKVL